MTTGNTSHSFNPYSHPDKLLRIHLENVGNLCRKTVKNLSTDLTRLGLSNDDLAELCWIIGVSHDYGKATPFFQEYLKEEDQKKKGRMKSRHETRHALFSSLFTYYLLKEMFKGHSSPIRNLIPFIGYEAVKRHHGNLQNLQGEIDGLKGLDVLKKQNESVTLEKAQELYTGLLRIDSLEFFKDNLEEIFCEIRNNRGIIRKSKKHGLEASILSLFCFSVLVSADKEDASGISVTRNPDIIQGDLIEKYRTFKGHDKPETDLNKIRNSIYLEAEQKVDELDLSDRILSLNMPTGSGKTLTGLNFALRLRDRIRDEKGYIPRIFYCVSFISIIDQNYKVFEEAYMNVNGSEPSSDALMKHHHLADILYDTTEDEHEYDPLDSLFLIEGWNSEVVFTTFVQLFHTLLSNRNRALRKYNKLANSIILLDEVQSIPHKYWLLLREVLSIFAEFFQTYFVFMTATMPLIFPREDVVEIVEGKEVYYSFFDRVDLHPSLKRYSLESFIEEAAEQVRYDTDRSYLYIMNTIRSSQALYEKLSKVVKVENLYYLSTMVAPRERLQRIDEIRNSGNRKVIVSTQLIEAGVDLDVDVVYRDMAPMDSVIQAAGRCNRNFGDRGTVYLVNLFDRNNRLLYEYIYGASSLLIHNTRSVLENISKAGEKEFKGFVDEFYGRMSKDMSSDKSSCILNDIRNLRFNEMKEFKLIEEDYPKVDVFVEYDEEAERTWKEYIDVMSIEDWKERKIRYLCIKKRFLDHVISIPVAHKNMVGITEDRGVGHISREDIQDGYFYDLRQGFMRDKQPPSTGFV